MQQTRFSKFVDFMVGRPTVEQFAPVHKIAMDFLETKAAKSMPESALKSFSKMIEDRNAAGISFFIQEAALSYPLMLRDEELLKSQRRDTEDAKARREAAWHETVALSQQPCKVASKKTLVL